MEKLIVKNSTMTFTNEELVQTFYDELQNDYDFEKIVAEVEYFVCSGISNDLQNNQIAVNQYPIQSIHTPYPMMVVAEQNPCSIPMEYDDSSSICSSASYMECLTSSLAEGETTSSSESNSAESDLTVTTKKSKSTYHKTFDKEKSGKKTTHLPQRRRPIKPAYLPELRVLRRDIRRRYFEMLQTVFNNHDTALTASFLNKFCVPTCDLVDVISDPNLPPHLPREKKMEGIEGIYNGLVYSFVLMPDMIFQSETVQVVVKQQSYGSRVVGKVRFTGTLMFHKPSTASQKTREHGPSFCVETMLNEFDNLKVTSDKLIADGDVSKLATVEDMRAELTLSIIPKAIEYEGIFTMFLDANHQIYRFLLELTQIVETPLTSSTVNR